MINEIKIPLQLFENLIGITKYVAETNIYTNTSKRADYIYKEAEKLLPKLISNEELINCIEKVIIDPFANGDYLAAFTALHEIKKRLKKYE